MTPLLEIRDLSLDFVTRTGAVHALAHVSLAVHPGELVGLVGESGSGKSVTAHAIMGLLDHAARLRAGEIRFEGTDLLRLRPRQLEEKRGRDLSIVFQNPRAALNPIRAVGTQIADVIARHTPGITATAIRARVLESLRAVRLADPERRMAAFPHELSGGMCQRIGIAMALACHARLLIADEPTSGLDVTTQAAVMDLVRDAVRAEGASAILITHDLALASQYCDRIVVMHAGHVVESAPMTALFSQPRHPYTAQLLASMPASVSTIDELHGIDGALPDLRRVDLPLCRFSERCTRHAPICDTTPLRRATVATAHDVACWRPL